ncbi:MAG: Zn2+/Cd2+-exporting ATPase [Moorella sp. (in: firmicutes)]|nr:Zn2+/Cd2+-exporting ATPase [Moorella sp. (in: firmicutes)]
MRYTLEGLDCASCAARIERELRKVKGLEQVTVNFANQSLDLPPELLPAAQEVIARVEPGVNIVDTTSQRPESQLYIILVAGLLLAIGFIFNQQLHRTPYALAEYTILLSSYFLVGWRVLTTAVRNLTRGQFFDENFLMTIATIGAIVIHQLPEAAAVMLFYAVGEYFQERAVNRSRRSIAALLDIRPEYANLKLNGETKQVRPEEVEVGQTIVV